MSTATQVLTPTKTTLGPLSGEERARIMAHAPSMTASARRMYRRLLILSQDRGLTVDAIAHAADLARERAALA